MQPIVFVNPFRCRMWDLHDRLEDGITAETCKQEIASFSKHGQLVPAMGRVLRGVPDYDVELIYGARRLFVARHINKQLAVELHDDLSDKDGIVAMDIENRHRTDISPYERGLSYARWLREGHFRSQDDIARALKISASQVSRLLKLSRLPSVVIKAFPNPADICEGWGLDLVDALADPQRRDATVRRARAIARTTVRLSAGEVYQQLLTAPTLGRKVKPRNCEEVIKDLRGTPLFRIRHQTRAIALLLPTDKVTVGALESIRGAIASILQAPSRRIVELSPPPLASASE